MLVSVDILVNPLMTDTNPLFHLDPARDLLRTPFLADQRLDLLPDLIANAGLNLVAPPPQRQIMGLAGPVALKTPISAQLPADCPSITTHYLGDLGLVMTCFLERINLVSFSLGKLRVAHLCSSYFGRFEKAAMLPQLALLPTL